MNMDEMTDREGIRQTMSNYSMAGDGCDAELFVAQFADDAVFEAVDRFKLEGIDAIRNWCIAWMKTPRDSFVQHNLATSRIEFTGKDTATARTYFTTYRNIGPDHAGVYTDRFVRKGDRWLFASRLVSPDWLSPNRPA
jgi:ketosteroid isomerase-like protein